MKNIFLIFSTLLISVFLSACNSNEEAQTIVEDNKSFQELKEKSNKTFNLKTTEGKTITFKVENDILSSEQLKGKVVLLNFWATWCPPCIKEIPIFNKLYEKYSDNFEIIGILYERDKDKEELADFIEKHKIKFPITVSEENFRIAEAFDDVKKIPESFLYGKDGKFIKKYLGEVPSSDLEAQIKK